MAKRAEDKHDAWISVGKELEAERAESNRLRDLLLQEMMTCERMRGYFDGGYDAQPPRMVPEEKPNQFGRFYAGAGNQSAGLSNGYGSKPLKPWYHR
jgi:hypothetical protein